MGLGIAAVIAVAAALFLLLSHRSTPSKVTVPNVVGQSEAAASATLQKAGLVAVPALHASTTVPSGNVIAASPPAGTRLTKGSRVTISVSTGPSSSALPEVVGLEASKATAKLRAAGFKPTTEAQASSTVASGRVISTDPPAGTELQAGSPVTVEVSSGPPQTTIPDVTGQSRAAAEATLSDAGLKVGAVAQQSSSEQTPGTVLAQSPEGGTSSPRGATVELTIAEAPKEVAVPDIVGQNEAQAAATLGRAGFTPKTSTQITTEASQVGLVLAQTPSAGHKARKGATVTIAVGTLGPQTTPTTTTPSTPATPTPPAASG